MIELAGTYGGSNADLARAQEDPATDHELIFKSRLAVSQSFAAIARMPNFELVRPFTSSEQAGASRLRAEKGPERSLCTWSDLKAGSDPRFFFDVDDGEVLHRDEVGVVLTSGGDVPRETKSLLTDLAYAAMPGGRPRLFVARVGDHGGRQVCEASVMMKPLPIGKSCHA